MSARTKAYLYLLTATAIWGLASAVIKFTLNGIDPIPFLAYRFLVSGVMGIGYFIIIRPKIPHAPRTIFYSILHGSLAYGIGLSLLFIGLSQTTVLDLSLIGTISPLIIIFGGSIFFKDKITHRERIGTLIALLGTVIAVIVPALVQNELRLSGNILLYGFLFADSAAFLTAKLLLKKGIPASVLSNIGMISAGIVFILLASLTTGLTNLLNIITSLPLSYHLGVWYMAIFSGTIAYYCMIRGMRTIEVSEAGLFYYLQPVFTIPIAIIWLQESVSTTFILGAIIIAGGVFIAEYKKRFTKK